MSLSLYPETTPHFPHHPEGWVGPRSSPEAMEMRKPNSLIVPAVEFQSLSHSAPNPITNELLYK